MLGFNWIISNKLAGSPQPGLYGDWDQDISYLKNAGISCVISLTEQALIQKDLEANEFTSIHFPIRDMDIPQPRNVFDLINKMRTQLTDEVFLLHCKGGVGRTGTIAACYLVAEGMRGEQAVKAVRTIHPSYIQTKIQESFVSHFKEYYTENMGIT